ncbi:MAG TPA: hypothetical protein VMZ28_12275 [Kofleriaceae bacterium]|nr:hypothetical protein [Kofleriaceae bacterium]
MTRYIIAGLLLSLSLAAGCGSGRTATRAPVKATELTSLSDHQCADVAAPPVPADDAAGECTAD